MQRYVYTRKIYIIRAILRARVCVRNYFLTVHALCCYVSWHGLKVQQGLTSGDGSTDGERYSRCMYKRSRICIYLLKKNDQNLIEENSYDIAFISCLGTAVGIIDLNNLNNKMFSFVVHISMNVVSIAVKHNDVGGFFLLHIKYFFSAVITSFLVRMNH